MKFTCVTKELEQAVKRIGTFAPKKSVILEETKMLVIVVNNNVTLVAGTYEISAEEKIATRADGDGAFFISSTPFWDSLKTCISNDVDLEYADSELKIMSNGASISLPTIPMKDQSDYYAYFLTSKFIGYEDFTKGYKVSGQTLKNSFEQTIFFAASLKASTPVGYLNGEYLSIYKNGGSSDSIEVAGCNGYALAVSSDTFGKRKVNDGKLIFSELISKRYVNLILKSKILDTAEKDIIISLFSTKNGFKVVCFKSENIKVCVRPMNFEYFDYRGAMLKSRLATVEVEVRGFLKTIEKCKTTITKMQPRIWFGFMKNGVRVYNKNSLGNVEIIFSDDWKRTLRSIGVIGPFSDEIYSFSGMPLAISVNYQYIHDAFVSLNKQGYTKATIEMQGYQTAMQISAGNVIYTILPIVNKDTDGKTRSELLKDF